MKKIMFNDKYNLTQAVLEGRKTQTRRIVDQRLYYLLNLDAKLYKMEIINSSRYKIGEIVAIAQSYQDCGYDGNDYITVGDGYSRVKYYAGWTNKMFVRAKAMKHHIKITNVRVERLQDISEEDCIAEGIRTAGGTQNLFTFNGSGLCYLTPKEAYARLIDNVCKKGTWKSNPWVFVYEFELID